jgi:cytosine/adenosine deaminase-related metal-dependent hydrolase
VEEAAIRKLPVAMHLAESRAELELLAAGTGPLRELLEQRSMWDAAAIPAGSTPLDYLRMLARAPRSLVIHGNYLSSAELDFVAEHRERMSIVYCPRTHEYFQHAEYRLQEMLAAGVRVALGTDSRASNPDLNLFDELRSVARKHDVPASEVIRLGTLSGAEALGWGDVVGSITPGKWADLIAVPCCEDDPTQAVLNHEGPPNHVWLRGEAIRD